MKSFDNEWEKIHASQEWGKYPSENVIRFIARNYYSKDRLKTRILDFGCGAGSNTWYLAKEGFDVYAFDGSVSAVEKTKKRLKEEKLNGGENIIVCDALELPYEEEYFDCVIDNAVVYANTYANINLMYSNIYRILKTDGKLFSVVFATETTGYKTGKEIEKNTYSDIQEGALAGRGITGITYYRYPAMRTISGGINLSF